jgi:hypothetical protein
MSIRLSVCPSVRPLEIEQLGYHWTDINETWYLSVFWKSIKKIQVSLKNDKDNGHFTWSPVCTFDRISLSSSQNDKCCGQNL